MELQTLSENTRKVRKSLLVVCLIGFAISQVGISIKKVTVLGTEFIIQNHQAIPLTIGLVIFYFLITFVFYALSEYSTAYEKDRRNYLENISGKTFPTKSQAIASAAELKNELEKLENEHGSAVGEKEKEKLDIRKKKKETESEYYKMKRIKDFWDNTKRSIYDVIPFKKTRIFVEFFIPVFIAIYILILLFFYTDFSIINS